MLIIRNSILNLDLINPMNSQTKFSSMIMETCNFRLMETNKYKKTICASMNSVVEKMYCT